MECRVFPGQEQSRHKRKQITDRASAVNSPPCALHIAMLGRLRSSAEFQREKREGGFWAGRCCSLNAARQPALSEPIGDLHNGVLSHSGVPTVAGVRSVVQTTSLRDEAARGPDARTHVSVSASMTHGPSLTLQSRVGLITSKKVGNAVHRNRARRLIRESLYQLADVIEPGWDIVLIAKPAISTSGMKMQDVRDEIQRLLNKARLARSIGLNQ